MIKTLFKKEVYTFFSSAIGYVVVGIFLTINGLFLWVFKGEFNILDNGFADLYTFFELSSWLLLFLVPAITMKGFSEEMKTGTLEILLSKPISIRQLVIAKFLGAYVLVLISLLPSVIYVYTIWNLGNPSGNMPIGSTLGAYVGLATMSMVFVAVGTLSSTLSSNQIIAYILGVFGCFLMYYGFEAIGSLGWNMDFIRNLGLKIHLDTSNKGILDLRDLIYFFSVTLLILIYAELKLKYTYN